MTGFEREFTVVFQPAGVRGHIAEGTSLRTAARKLGVEIESICADNASCGKCRVLIEEGTKLGIDSSPDHASPMGPTEEPWISKRWRTWKRMGFDIDRLRLSCQARVHGDMVVFVPESSQANRTLIRKDATDRPIEIRPPVRRYHVRLLPATVEHPLGDAERLAQGLVKVIDGVHAGYTSPLPAPAPEDLEFGIHVLRQISEVMRTEDWNVTVTVFDNREVIDVQPGFAEDMYGAAIDIGTTTIAVYICDLFSGEIVVSDSMVNPQVTMGDDIMSRMTYEADNEDGLAALNSTLIEGINRLLARAVKTLRVKPTDLYELVVVGNTTMHHLFLGLTTQNLGLVPFVPTIHRSLDVKARDLGLEVNAGANVHLLPIAASFVGADTLATLLAEEPHHQDESVLLIDIGTNAELVLANKDTILCTSTPTGPAFEGAHIEYGMRAAPGAIERVRIDKDTLEPSYDIIGVDKTLPRTSFDETTAKGICGSAIIDGVAEMFRVGILNPRGNFALTNATPRIRKGDLGWEYVIATEAETSIGRDIPITLADVRQIQLAKAALYTAAQVLLDKAGIAAPDRILLAGGFGSYINATNAMIIGMIPDCPLDHVRAVGNSAGDGARIALLNRFKRREAAEVVASIKRVELPVTPGFQDQFMMAVNFPHMYHAFPSIEHLIPAYGPDPLVDRFTRESS